MGSFIWPEGNVRLELREPHTHTHTRKGTMLLVLVAVRPDEEQKLQPVVS